MRTIHKYPLAVTDLQTLLMPVGRKVLSVGQQNGTLMVWAEVDLSKRLGRESFWIRGTGQPFEAEGNFLGIVQMPNGLVWHVYHACSD